MISNNIEPVGVDDEGVVVVQLLGHQFILLGSLVLSVVIEAARESDLRVVMDVTSNLKRDNSLSFLSLSSFLLLRPNYPSL